jgi:hypothetical protein
MPSRKLPNTTSAVIRTLTTARDAWGQYPTARLITPAQWAKLDPVTVPPNPPSLLTTLLKEAGDVPAALAAQAPLTDIFQKGLARLTLYVSHFHQTYDFGVLRGDFTAGGRAYYDRDVSATTLPDLSTATAVLNAAAKIGTGEAERATAEGAAYKAMANPAAAEVAALYATVKAEYDASQAAQAFTDQQQNELAALYPDAQKLAVQICNTVEYTLENDEAYATLDAAGRRAIAVRWGVVYLYENATTVPAPTPAPTPAATPTSTPAPKPNA